MKSALVQLIILPFPGNYYEEVRNNTKQNSDNTLEYEKQSPTTVTTNTVQITIGTGKEAAKCTGTKNGTPIDSKSLLGFFTLVPKANNIEAYYIGKL